MSIKFGLYLVEQGIISCDQFCGLLKIQQLTIPSPASVAIRRNLLTVKQLGQILALLELNPGLDFYEAGRRLNLLDANLERRFEQERQLLLPSLSFLLVECGVLNARQVEMLQRSFEKSEQRVSLVESQVETNPVQPPQSVQPELAPVAVPAAAVKAANSDPAQGSSGKVHEHRVHAAQPLRQPKFVQRPQVSIPEEAYYG